RKCHKIGLKFVHRRLVAERLLIFIYLFLIYFHHRFDKLFLCSDSCIRGGNGVCDCQICSTNFFEQFSFVSASIGDALCGDSAGNRSSRCPCDGREEYRIEKFLDADPIIFKKSNRAIYCREKSVEQRFPLISEPGLLARLCFTAPMPRQIAGEPGGLTELRMRATASDRLCASISTSRRMTSL